MMNLRVDIINEAIEIAGNYEFDQIVGKLNDIVDSSETQPIKVVVMGEIASGKSTLLREVFLQGAAFPDEVGAYTSVPVWLKQGERLMHTWLRCPNEDEISGEKTTEFTAADVARVVRADTRDKRHDLRKRFSRVEIHLNDMEALDGVLIDTPGLNSSSDEQTLGVARKAEALLYVVRARQLSVWEKELIATKLAGAQREKLPLLVVITSDADTPAAALEKLRDHIEAELDEYGIACKPVLYLPGGQNEATKEDLRAFIRAAAEKGASARLARDLYETLDELYEAIVGYWREVDRKQLFDDEARKKRRNRKKDYEDKIRQLMEAIGQVRARMARGIEKGFDQLRDAYVDELHDDAKVLDFLRREHTNRVKHILRVAKKDAENDMSAVFEKYRDDFSLKDKTELLPREMEDDLIENYMNLYSAKSFGEVTQDEQVYDSIEKTMDEMKSVLRDAFQKHEKTLHVLLEKAYPHDRQSENEQTPQKEETITRRDVERISCLRDSL